MKISAVKLYDKGYMLQPFAFGGEDGPEAFDPAVRYRSSLQNYVIDTGDEVILVDTGMPKEVPQAVPDAASGRITPLPSSTITTPSTARVCSPL